MLRFSPLQTIKRSGLKSLHKDRVNEQAGSILSATDWYSIRAAEGGTAMPADVKTKRAEERAKVVDYANFSG